MIIDRYHLTLTVALAALVGFGAAHLLSSGDAVAYPSGAAVSYGADPVVSTGGVIDLSSPATAVLTAPSDQALIVTDVVLTLTRGGSTVCDQTVTLATGSGDVIAQFSVVGHGSINGNMAPYVAHAFSSGLPVPPGETLDLTAGTSNCDVYYTLSGYYAQP